MNDPMFENELARGFSSPSQRARILSERWTQKHAYCPACGHSPLVQAKNNAPVLDFKCLNCLATFELKSKHGSFGPLIIDGAYDAMIRRLAERESPSLFLLTYRGDPPGVSSLGVIPRQFLVPSLIEERRPLAATARRSGWVGCNIILAEVPEAGRITMFEAGLFRPTDEVVRRWQRTLFLRDLDGADSNGWLVQMMAVIDQIRHTTFSLDDVYAFEGWFQKKHPANSHLRPKMRQQLQRLRDAGHIEFISPGHYRLIPRKDC